MKVYGIMNFKTISFILILSLFIVSIGCVSASEINDNITISQDIPINTPDDFYQDELSSIDFQKSNESNVVTSNSQDSLQSTESDDVIVVNNWDELQYYCSLKDNDYTLKLKDNTNFYPTRTSDSNYQIKVYNNVKIIGGNGSYIGDKSSNPSPIVYTAIVVPDGYKSSIYLENVTFKWISALGSPDGLFIQMGGKYNSVIKNCNFTNINVGHGHATIVYLKKGTATLENCSFINCTSGYGCVSIYDSENVKKIKMIVRDCYFEGNYASTEPGCINNCGILEVYNSTFYRNRAYWWAGAIHTHNGGNTTIYDSNFTDNVAGWNGGALYTYSYLQIYNTVFSGNNCTTDNGGGAIGACAYISNPHIYIEKCLFENNANNCWAADSLSSGTGRGGAISIMDDGSLEVHDTTFIANSASIGAGICALAISEYGSPDVIIANNSFINHTRQGDTLDVRVSGSIAILEDNIFQGNSIRFSNLTLTKISEDKDYATLEVYSSLSNPSYYDVNILDKTSYDIYINNEYVKTVDSRIFTIDFDELDTCDVYVIPTISNQKSHSAHLVSTREYIFVSKNEGNDSNNGISRNTPVSSIKRALELAGNCQSILIMDGDYSEANLQVNYDLLIKGEGNATLVNNTSFIVNTNSLTLKNLKIDSIVGESFIKQINGNLIIDKCIFNDNNVSKLIDADKVNITKSIFTNNNMLIYNNGFTNIKNSILLNNTKIIDNNLGNIDLDYNWWGNTLNNVSKPVNLNINNWLVLNVTRTKDSLEIGQTSIIQFGMYLFENNKVINYNDLIKFNLASNASNASVNKNTIDYNGKVIYTQSSLADSIFTASYNNVVISLPFKFLKSSPNLSIKFSNIRYNDDLIITVSAPKDITGDVSVTVGRDTTTKPLTNGVKFTFKYLEAGDYNITVNYNGNGKYLSQVIKDSVNVRKYDSTTKISLGNVNVGEDLKITVSTSRGTTGNVNLTINNHSEILTLKNVEASYVFKNIPRGDYLITVYYIGDDRNLPSQDEYFLEVDNLIPNLAASVADSNYGEVAVIDVILDGDAEGYVTATIDGITNSSKVSSGKSKIYLKGAEAGINRNITIFYSGDNTYLNKTITANMNIFKNNFTFNISSEDIFIGHDAVVTIKVPFKTGGNFTIGDVVLSIPMSGEVSYVIPDLEVGKYTITAVYNGNNYFTVENSTSFEVFEYPAPQWMNDGADTKNSQKTDYISSSNGNVSWVSQINSTVIANIVIDSEGNLYLATTNGIYSYDNEGNLRWIYESDGRIGNFSGLAIGRDVIISPRAGDTIYLIRNTLNLVNQTTGEKYGDSNIYQASSLFVPIIDANAFIYTVSEYQFEGDGYNLVITPFKIWEGGGQPIQVSLGKAKPIAPPSVNDDMMVVVCQGSLMIFDAKTLSANSIKTGDFKNIRPVIGDGNIVYTILGNSIVAYTIGGSQYGSKIPITGGSGDKLLIDNDLGFLYATNADGHLYSYDLFTQEETLISSLSVTSGILIDGDHNLYFASNNIFYCIDPTGEVLWKSNLGSRITSNPIMNKDGVIYVTSTDNKLFALSNKTSDNSTADVKGNVSLRISASDVNVGEDAIIQVTSSESSIKITVQVNNREFNITGSGNVRINDLAAGKYNAIVRFAGDDNFNPASNSTSFNVLKVKIQVTDGTFTLPDDNSTVCSVNLPSDATGILTVTVDGKTYTETLTNGKATVNIHKLNDGSHNITVTYSGDGKYEPIIKTSVIIVNNTVGGNSTGGDNSTNSTGDNTTVVKVDPVLVVSAGDVSIGESAVVNVRTSVETGKVVVNVNKVDYELVISNGESSVSIPDLAVGNYTVIARFAGDDKFNEASNSTTFSVLKVSVPVTNETISIPEGNSTEYSISLPADATGTLTVTVDGKKYTQTLTNGKATVNIPKLNDGSHNITVTYSGDAKYESITKSSVVNVNTTVIDNSTDVKDNVTIIVSAGDITVGDDALIKVTSSQNSIKITVTVNDKDYEITGSGTLTVPDLAVGKYNVVAKFVGDDKFNGAVNSTEFNVLKVDLPVTNETISVPESDSTKYSISLPADATGTLTVTVDGVPYTQSLSNGKATVTIPELAEGSHNITVTYSGDGKYLPITKSSVVVKEHVPVIKLTGSNLNMLYSSGKYFKVRLTSDGKALSGKSVKITINGKTYTKTTDKNGYASMKISLPPKAYSVKATYGDVTITKKVTVKSIISAKNINAKKSAKTVKIKVTLKKVNGKYLKNKKVTLKFNKKTFKVKTNKKGVATFTIKNSVYKKLKANKKYTYQVIYGKDKVKKTIKFK